MSRWPACLLFLIILALAVSAGASEDSQERLGFSRLEVNAGHSLVVNLPQKVKRVSVGNPEIADVLMITPRQLYVSAKAPGSTNISLWEGEDGLLGVFEVRVARDLTRLKKHLYEILPGEAVEVRELEGAVVLSGRVSSRTAKEQAEAVANVFAPKAVANVLKVGGTRQVLLKVRFAEVSKNALKKLNFNLGFFNPAGAFGFTFLDGLVNPIETAIGLDSFSTQLDFSPNMNGMFGFNAGGARFLGFLEALKQNGLARILAEPNLVATSGEKAEFLAGGEYPIPVPQKENITITFKKYGVQLTFIPEITDDGRVRLKVTPEVSELDYSNAVVIDTFAVPGLITRRAQTELELDNGQSFAIAGLFRDDITESVSKVPFLGDIPVLGALFRSTNFQSKKTELVIVVTPEIIRPGEHRPPTSLPGTDLKAPGDLALFFLGSMPEPRPGGEGGAFVSG